MKVPTIACTALLFISLALRCEAQTAADAAAQRLAQSAETKKAPPDSVGNFPRESGFLAGATYTTPLGARFILGFEIHRWFALFLGLNLHDAWSRDGARKHIIGMIMSLPIKGTRFSPNAEVGGGTEPYRSCGTHIGCDNASSFWYVSLGTRYYVSDYFFLKTAIAYSETNAYISGGGKDFVRPAEPRIDERAAHIGISLGIGVTALMF